MENRQQQPPRMREREFRNDELSQLSKTAQILATLPLPVYVFFMLLVVAFIGLAVWFDHQHLDTFTSNVLDWIVRILIVLAIMIGVRLIYGAYLLYNEGLTKHYEQQAIVKKNKLMDVQLDKANVGVDQARAILALQQLAPLMAKYAMEQGHNIELSPKGELKVINWRSNIHMMQPGLLGDAATPAIAPPLIKTFRELLEDGTIMAAIDRGEMLLGYQDGVLRYGTLERNIRSCGVGGGSGSGKTTGVRFLLFQGLLMRAKLLMIDPHLHEPEESLAHQFQMFKSAHIMPPCDKRSEEVSKRVQWITKEYDRREAKGIKGPFIFVVIDEFNELMRALGKQGKAELINPLLNVAQGGRKFGIFCMLIGQRWSDQDLGGQNMGAAIRSSLHSSIAYRFKEESQAGKLLGGGDAEGRKCLDLADGHNWFRDTEGQLNKMITPLTRKEDGDLVLEMLARLEAENTVESGAENTENRGLRLVSGSGKTPLALPYTVNFQRENAANGTENTVENTRIHDLAGEVMRLSAEGMLMGDIIKEIWNASPGGTEAYKQAKTEYQEVMKYIAGRWS